MADSRYLKQRRAGWYFQIAVPSRLREAMGKATITASLQTRDLTVAQGRRWAKLIEAQEAFAKFGRRPAGQRIDTEALLAVDDLARATYHDTLARMDAEARAGTRAWDATDLSETYAAFVDAYLAGTFGPVAEILAAYCERQHIEPGTALYGELGDALLSAKMQAVMGRKNALEHKPSPEPDTFLNFVPVDPVSLRPLRTTPKGTGLEFADVAARFLAERDRDPAFGLTKQTRGQYEMAYRLFDRWANQPTLDSIDRRRASDFLDAIASLNPLWGRGPGVKDLSFTEIAERFGGHKPGLSAKTVNRYSMALSMVWQFAEDRDGYEGKNPWQGQRRATAKRRGNSQVDKRAFTPAEVRKLIERHAVLPTEAPDVATTLPWLTLIAAYSGMRLNEVCELTVSDVKKVGGIWYFDVRASKTGAGVRFVPVHPKIIEAGFLTYLEGRAKGVELWPALKPGGPDEKRSWYVSKRFTEYRRDLGLIDIDSVTGRDRLDFHSLRRSAVSALKRAGVAEHEVAEIVGHEHPNITFGVYADRAQLTRLKAIVEAISYAEAVAQ